MNPAMEIRLVGPGGAGKSTIGALLAESLEVTFIDLDRHLAGRVGDISGYIGRHGYDVYARENVETYCAMSCGKSRLGVVALSSGFMTYVSTIPLNDCVCSAQVRGISGDSLQQIRVSVVSGFSRTGLSPSTDHPGN
jgi:Shikimate kinase